MKNTTIVDVANHAGVSKKTVSRVINNETGVGAATREKVLASVKALNFRRSPFGLSLAKKRSFLVALVYDNPNPHFIAPLQLGITAACQKRDLGLYVHYCDYTSEKLAEDIEQMIDRTMVDGLILTSPVCDQQALIDTLRERDISFVSINPSDTSIGLSVQTDSFQGAKDATNHLISLGHKDIAIITGHKDLHTSKRRALGFFEAMNTAGLSVNDEWVIAGENTFESGQKAIEQLLGLYQRPSAIFCSNDESAIGALNELNRRGLNVPDDISLVGFDDVPASAQLWPPLTTAKQPFTEIGHKAASLLIDQFQDKKDSKHTHCETVECPLIVRKSSTQPAA